MPHRSHAHSHSLSHQLQEAEKICAARKERLTPQRREVYLLLLQEGRPLKAYDLLRRLSTKTRAVKPPTVYRALDFLLKMGLVHRVEALDAFLACLHQHPHHSSQLLVCGQCGDVRELHGKLFDEAVQKLAKSASFTPSASTVEIQGCCAACREGAHV